MQEAKLRIGISMRVTNADGYDEKRDSLAQDWAAYMLSEFPLIEWLYIPNIQDKVISFVERWGLNGFVLSGGENIGIHDERDITERLILEYAIRRDFPLLGICRGMQVIHEYFGGKIEKGDTNFDLFHTAKIHSIKFRGTDHEVNSYHRNRLDDASLSSLLKVEARCNFDQSIEAISGGDKLLGLMWHPERKFGYNDWNTGLIKDFFNYYTFGDE